MKDGLLRDIGCVLRHTYGILASKARQVKFQAQAWQQARRVRVHTRWLEEQEAEVAAAIAHMHAEQRRIEIAVIAHLKAHS